MISRIIGFAASLIFTLTAYFIIRDPEFFHLKIKLAISIILILAVLQAMAQSIFFLHVLTEKGPRWNLLIFISTITVVVIIIAFSIWIMNHLNYNMMMSNATFLQTVGLALQ